jgi:ribosome assembly protein SQT1
MWNMDVEEFAVALQGKRIVTVCADNSVIYWDPPSPTPLFKLTGVDVWFDLGSITMLAVDPASTVAVVCGLEGVHVVSLLRMCLP